ncbi:hypothetical protein M407DRAFT_242212 [Tulasnella calospora MUT 4182]|uniref:ubiquitinyl hydrolase 1 n=1 Tax=Tulasnella calospora MUT 4182 TaxID=1051891 RepID=A0A0C3M9U5_9AGAM|nr:hypothetical protein M407DRAFT_242212 [Tulasnella calospora MUT 4182]
MVSMSTPTPTSTAPDPTPTGGAVGHAAQSLTGQEDKDKVASMLPRSETPGVPGDENQLSEHDLYQLAQQLKDEEANKRPLISSAEPLSALREEYTNGTGNFLEKIEWLMSQGWRGLRRTRGDGDCFYRSLAYAYVERLLFADDQDLAVASTKSILEAKLKVLEQVGFEKLAYEDFYDAFVEVIDLIVKPNQHGRKLDANGLLEFFQTPELSNSAVFFLKLVTSAQMRSEPALYEGFLMNPDTGDPMGVKEFCERFVEAAGKEADDPMISALTSALSVPVNVAYLSNAGFSDSSHKVNFVEFQSEGTGLSGAEPITLLYRPGHYDILEKRADDLETRPDRK